MVLENTKKEKITTTKHLKNKIMKNIHVLPTDKPSRLYKTGDFLLLDSKAMPNNALETKNQHIYITSDEEIKEGDWVLYTKGYKIHYQKLENKNDVELANIEDSGAFKIILTKDQDLIKDGVQAINDEFLEWFVAHPNCEWVKVIYEPKNYLDIKQGWEYEIIIPKEEPKQETQGYICPRTKKQCDDECCVSAEDCHIEASFGVISDCEPPKQETLEVMKKEQTESIKITTAVEDIIEVIKMNEKSEKKADLLLVAEEKLKKETNQRFIAHRIGKIDVIRDVLIKQSFLIKEMFDELKELAEPSEYDKIVGDFLNKINK